MYSKKIRELLDKKKIKTGDRITIVKGNKKIEGLLMPQTEMGDPETIVTKLDNGYNIGLSMGKGTFIEKSTYGEPKNVKEEEEFELGKVKKSLLNLEFNSKKPPVSLISTGGTIASRVDYRTGGVYPLEDPKEFLHNIPELVNIINLRKLVSPFAKASEDMDSENWKDLAKKVAEELNSGSKGVIITHGTDTLHYTSAALSFFLKNLSKPVVLVGAQRSSDRGSSDAGINLICSAHAAISDIGEVGICMHGSVNDDYCLFIRGVKARKMHTSRRDAFRPVNEPPLARIFPDGKIDITNNNFKKRKETETELDAKFEPRVAIVKVYPGSDPQIMNYYLDKRFKGFVIEGTGLGHVPTFAKSSWIETIKKTIKNGIPVVVTSQTIYGRVNPNVYTNLRILYNEAGAIPGEDMLTETAYVKLGWVLAHAQDLEEIRKQILTNYAGEITGRIITESFLY